MVVVALFGLFWARFFRWLTTEEVLRINIAPPLFFEP